MKLEDENSNLRLSNKLLLGNDRLNGNIIYAFVSIHKINSFFIFIILD